MSIVNWFVFLIVYQYIPTNVVVNPNELYYVPNNMFKTAIFWLLPALSLAVCCLPDLAYK